jgi:hypothetical protein
MIPLPLLLGLNKTVVCHCQSIWCCNSSVAKEVNEKQLAKSCAIPNRVFFCPLFYRDPVQKLHGFPFCPYLRLQTRLLLTCGFMFCWTYLVLSWCFSIIKINAGLLSVLKFRLFAKGIQISIMCHCTLQPFQD